jgi:putative ABC transport system permease protein
MIQAIPRPRRIMDLLLKDVRYGLRRLAASPLFTAVAIVSLALGIGANSAIFSIVNAVLLRELPVPEPDRLVDIYTSDRDGLKYATSSYPDFDDLRAASNVFTDIASYELFIGQAEVEGSNQMVMGEIVSGNYFDMLGVKPALGRTFAADERTTPGAAPVVVLGHAFWKQTFDSDPGVIGRVVRIQRRPFTVIGVLPAEYHGMFPGLEADMYASSMMVNQIMASTADRLVERGNRGLFLKARLAPGISVEQASAAVDAIAARLAREYPTTDEGLEMTVLASSSVSVHPMVDRALVPVAGLLLSVVGLVLLIACANLASFLLARATDRRREIAVRLALGASRAQLVRQLVIESVFLSLLGGIAGILVANWVIHLIVGFQPPLPIPIHVNLGIDSNVLLFTLVVSLVAGLAFGLVPGLQATKPDLSGTLRDEAGAVIGGRKRVGLRGILVAGQVAVSLLLLVSAGLFLRSLGKAQKIDAGFYTGPAAILWPQFEMSGFDEARGKAAQNQLAEQLRALPGVTGVAMASRLPLGVAIQTRGLTIDGVEPPPGLDQHHVDVTQVDAAYFDVLDVPIIAGRNFEAADLATSPTVAIISEAAARHFWPSGNAVGSTFYTDTERQRPVRIVGVAADTKVRTLGESPRPYFYLDADQQYIPSMMLVVRGSANAAELVAQARTVALDLDPQLILLDSKTMSEHLALMLYPPRMAAILLSVFGGLALLLATIGLYGTVSYAVARRTREVGVRSALGASRRDLVLLLTGGGMRLIGIGSLIGLVLAAALTWLISGFLYGIRSMDVVTFAAVPAILGLVGFLASWVPARRASRIDPMIALRSD